MTPDSPQPESQPEWPQPEPPQPGPLQPGGDQLPEPVQQSPWQIAGDPGEAAARSPLGAPGPSWDGTAPPPPLPSPAPPPAPRGGRLGGGLLGGLFGGSRAARQQEGRPEAAPRLTPTGPETAAGTKAEKGVAGCAPAPFWRRAVGYALDVVVLVIMLTLLTAATGIDFQAASDGDASEQANVERLYVVVIGMRVVYYWTWNTIGWSPGKRMMGLRIVREDGAAPGLSVGFARTVISLISDLALGIGYLWAAWDRRGQTWHDKMAGTHVVMAPQPEHSGESDWRE